MSIDWTTIATAIISALVSSGGATAYYTYRLRSRTLDNDHVTRLLDAVAERDRHITDLRVEVETLRKEMVKLRKQLTQYEEATAQHDAVQIMAKMIDNLGFPVWLHEVGHNRWFVNESYCEEFGVDRPSFWTPINIMTQYPVELSSKYVQHDMAVIESGCSQVFVEQVSRNVLNHNSERFTCEITKFPLVAGGRKYVVGMASIGKLPWGNSLPIAKD